MATISIKRVFVEKKDGYNVEAKHLLQEIKDTLGVSSLKNLRILNRYDFTCKNEENFEKITNLILSEPNVDKVYINSFPSNNERVLGIEYLPGQYDQRADSAIQSIQVLVNDLDIKLKSARIILLEGLISDDEFKKIKEFCINPIDAREAKVEIPISLDDEEIEVEDIEIIKGFIELDDNELENLKNELGFAMSFEDLSLIKEYFTNDEKRNPTITELKVIDTYWSDHCRHTTFFTEIEDIKIEEGKYKEVIEEALSNYLKSREFIETKKPITLMDLATINAKQSKKMGLLDDLDVSDEINACSIEIDVNIDNNKERWLLMFKNETHNHPTEIEPFGGASTCLGGAIRDPLSGRSYVYQAMRVTGSGDPRVAISETIPGKLPQRKITKEAAKGYSSYGNQIGAATGQVTEIYHDGYIAKRMECGAVIAAAPKENVIRKKPQVGDIVLLVGAKTGRDGIGGATSSSKSHTEEVLKKASAEVQKGNPPEERKIVRLFRNPKVSKLIKKCNDFGAGGVSVAIGELADSLVIDLDTIPTKYEGLDGTELAIAESQERMAVVIDAKDFDEFKSYGDMENLEITKVADITNDGRLIMKWRNKVILDISRRFLDTNGARQYTRVNVTAPKEMEVTNSEYISFEERLLEDLSNLNICSQQGLVEIFDSTVGAATVLMPFGGKYRLTPPEGMVAKIPVLKGNTNTCSLMSFGFDPEICSWSPYHGGIYSIVDAAAKIVAMGGDYRKIRLSMQEYFEKLDKDPSKWGKPFSALLGAYYAQDKLNIASIGGKDSMSGTYKDISVPPTIIAFAVTTDITENILSPEFKETNSNVYLIQIDKDEKNIPNFETIKSAYDKLKTLVNNGHILSAKTVSKGGVATAISKMSFGNKIGFEFSNLIDSIDIFEKQIGSIIIEVEEAKADLVPNEFILVGKTTDEPSIRLLDESVELDRMIQNWEEPLKNVFPIKQDLKGEIKTLESKAVSKPYNGRKIGAPRVFIPIFPGTNGEYDSIKAFETAGAIVNSSVFRNKSLQGIQESFKIWANEISQSQILMIPGGASTGDEPDGAGKFIATVFRNEYIAEAIMDLIKNRDGLILGISNGFQALIKLGLLPYGEIKTLSENAPTLTLNINGRHVSQLAATKVVSKLSPWLKNTGLGDVYTLPISNREGRFVATEDVLKDLISKGQIATQYVDLDGNATYDGYYNPSGSLYAVEGLTSSDGRILGKMAHSERVESDIYKNVPGEKNQGIFKSGVEYYKI